MTYGKMIELISKIIDNSEFEVFGVRFEDKEREVGEKIFDKSRSNCGREDEREFPEYRTPEYQDMEELSGVSAWYADPYTGKVYMGQYADDDRVDLGCLTEHCYFLGAMHGDSGEDEGEIILEDARVLAVIF